MYSYNYDVETGGIILNSSPLHFSKEPRPVYYKELDILGFDKHWKYEKNDEYPYMWAEANNYFYRGRKVAKTRGGSCYTAPEIIILDTPEPNGAPLKFVDVPAMVEKNREILESLVQDTIKKVYNTYIKYKDKVDIFYVAFSGGKDSIVTLDIVQRALPHNGFMVLFGDTGMEFPDTYEVISEIERKCKSKGIRFERAKSSLSPEYTWNIIGPPAQKMRWCCSVHKTAPQIILLRKIAKKNTFRGMAMMGVRADESVSRSKYDELNFGTKHQGQYDFYPILNWNSAELFLYLYQEKLIINETYKNGNSRAGCLVCPMEAVKNTWFKNQLYSNGENYSHTTTFYNNIIKNKTIAHDLPKQNLFEFMEIGVWKSRHNGNKLFKPQNIYHEIKSKNDYIFILDVISDDWREWFKTLGQINYKADNSIVVNCNDNNYYIEHYKENKSHIFKIKDIKNTREYIYFLSWLKIVLKKCAYCINCQVCEANCPNGFIKMENGHIQIDDKCTKCKKCYKVNGGCVVAASHHLPKELNRMNGSIDQYKNMGIQYNWVIDYFKKKDDFWNDNTLGSQMLTSLNLFLRQADISIKKQITPFGELIYRLGADTVLSWALILCNLAYSPQFNWWILNIEFNHTYIKKELEEMISELSLTDNSKKNVISSLKNILYSNSILSKDIGLGTVTVIKKGRNTFLDDVIRTPWQSPDPRVILYSLFKFAEACGGYYQFTLSRLLNYNIESDGVSPSLIFGLDKEQMEKILTGLSINYPEYINATFTLDLDNITLRSDKTADDVLSLF